MAQKLTLDLTLAQVRALHSAAPGLAAASTGEEQARWAAIARKAARALAYHDRHAARAAEGVAFQRAQTLTEEA